MYQWFQIHIRAAGRLDLVIRIKHLLHVTDSMHINHGWRMRWLWRLIGSVSEVWLGSSIENQARCSKLIGMVATWFRKKLFSFMTCS